VVSDPLSIENACDRINVGSRTISGEPQKEEAPGAGTPNASAHHQGISERQADMSVSTLADENDTELKDRALVCLDELRRQQEQARYHRLFYMRLARQYGATYREIGESLGITLQAARQTLIAAGDEVAP